MPILPRYACPHPQLIIIEAMVPCYRGCRQARSPQINAGFRRVCFCNTHLQCTRIRRRIGNLALRIGPLRSSKRAAPRQDTSCLSNPSGRRCRQSPWRRHPSRPSPRIVFLVRAVFGGTRDEGGLEAELLRRLEIVVARGRHHHLLRFQAQQLSRAKIGFRIWACSARTVRPTSRGPTAGRRISPCWSKARRCRWRAAR